MLTEKQLEFKKHWLEDLRSGKYKQITGRLGDGNTGRCCLGVAADVAIELGCQLTVSVETGQSPLYHGHEYRIYSTNKTEDDTVLPRNVIEYLDIPMTPAGYFTIFSDSFPFPDLIPKFGLDSLGDYNDEGLTFNQIADIIDWVWN